MVNKYFFTFGSNTLYHNNYYVIEAENRMIARAVMFETYGNNWAFCYSESEFGNQAKIYNLKEIKKIL